MDVDKLSYLIPIKPLFFNYFDTEDLLDASEDGKNMFEMEAVAGGSVKVTLRIPIKGNNKIKHIEYTRIYYKDRVADMDNNEGGMTEFSFTGLVMPLVKYQNTQDAYYSVACVSAYSNKYDFSFYKEASRIEANSNDCRNLDGQESNKANVYTLTQQGFGQFHGIPRFLYLSLRLIWELQIHILNIKKAIMVYVLHSVLIKEIYKFVKCSFLRTEWIIRERNSKMT